MAVMLINAVFFDDVSRDYIGGIFPKTDMAYLQKPSIGQAL